MVLGTCLLVAVAGCAPAGQDADGDGTGCTGKCDSETETGRDYSGTTQNPYHPQSALRQIRSTTVEDIQGKPWEFIVVGAGAGGGPLAANLARAGRKVLLLEAGEYVGNRYTYQIPAFHTLSTEDPAMAWDYYVDHYPDAERARRDSKYVEDEQGILYPRAGTLGGCTAHNAMITVFSPDRDWNRIAQITGDDSWRASEMRRYRRQVENNLYAGKPNPRERVNGDYQHGFSGWLRTERSNLWLVANIERMLRDNGKLFDIVEGAAEAWDDESFGTTYTGQLKSIALGEMNEDPTSTGLYRVPQATRKGRRNGVLEYILETVERGYPLTVKTNALVTNVVFEQDGSGQPEAAGVEFLDGGKYAADPRVEDPAAAPMPEKHTVRASRETILSAGAFNTPQLLMLSGIGPEDHLEDKGIDPRVDLPGVGRNLQDRYEVGIVTEMTRDGEDTPFELVENCDFATTDDSDDPCRMQWLEGEGPYTSNGAVVGMRRRSSVAGGEMPPDLFIFGLPGQFRGYEPGYSEEGITKRNRFTWAILKSHTRNRAGRITLRSKDPRETPDIDFNYFDAGTTERDADDKDLQAMVDAVQFVRRIVEETREEADEKVKVTWPRGGLDALGRSAELKKWIKQESWGHHASCSAKMGDDEDPMAVLDSRFRVRGTEDLRVVDASIFPEIPGYFIVMPIYAASEKAADVILEDNPEEAMAR